VMVGPGGGGSEGGGAQHVPNESITAEQVGCSIWGEGCGGCGK
jgi:hypothetical protein